MLKGYAREKIMQILKKNAVEFISADFGIYLCLLLLDPSLGFYQLKV